MCKFLQKDIRKSQNDKRILNLVLKFKSGNIWPPDWSNNGRQLAKSDILRLFEFFLCAKKWVKGYLIYILRPDLEPFHHSATLLSQFVRICTFWFMASHSNFKIPITLADQNEHF